MLKSLGKRLHRFVKKQSTSKHPLKHAGVLTTLAESYMHRLQVHVINSPFILL